MIFALLRLCKSLSDDFRTIATFARGWLVALLRCWKSLADGFLREIEVAHIRSRMIFALLRLWRFSRSNHFGSRPRTACCAIAILEVARELLFAPIRLPRTAFCPDTTSANCFLPRYDFRELLFAPIRLWQSLEDDFRAAAPLEVARGWPKGAIAPLEVVCATKFLRDRTLMLSIPIIFLTYRFKWKHYHCAY
jgi:hypothetical protein